MRSISQVRQPLVTLRGRAANLLAFRQIVPPPSLICHLIQRHRGIVRLREGKLVMEEIGGSRRLQLQSSAIKATLWGFGSHNTFPLPLYGWSPHLSEGSGEPSSNCWRKINGRRYCNSVKLFLLCRVSGKTTALFERLSRLNFVDPVFQIVKFKRRVGFVKVVCCKIKYD